MKGTAMRSAATLWLVLITTSPAFATEPSDVRAVVDRFVEAVNRADNPAAAAACAASASVTDDFAPHNWQGPNACANWLADFDTFAKGNAMTAVTIRITQVQSNKVTADRAYFVSRMSYRYKRAGKAVRESGVMTIALHKEASGWLFTSWTWADQ
jgi:ketosteroid isomerase-like protein